MSPDTKPSRATGTQKITSMAGQSRKKFYKDIFPVSTGRVASMTTRSGMPVQQFSTCNKMLDFIISTTFFLAKVDDEAVVNGRVEQTEEGPMLNLMSIGCTQSKRLFWRRPTPKQLKRLVEIFGEEPRWFEDFYTKEEFDFDLMH